MLPVDLLNLAECKQINGEKKKRKMKPKQLYGGMTKHNRKLAFFKMLTSLLQ